MTEKVPEVIVDPSDYQEVLKKLDLVEEKVEFTHSEMQQKIGTKMGRDIGTLYGLCIGLMIVVIYLLLAINMNETDLLIIMKSIFQI
ncbi:MAG: tetrahydromethanopterin S-methyltransferase subunit G [ANME-2 cluster archaeon]|nr:tetrahydromethanopterin S-methyltransferase subunit G [ANME-2 cluster archaeon]MBC2702021.1 tetrahydromethanopterin S-methyltransferase subunit G [ANME-2 cluster archaeon]MBC2706654.1 tetrahydromethanopterin S-methyltransferase subunit G [ANME-2 cluster archaeon]MBC2748731.1 tetrahydromethanopterin S-methyltransferase subunit G [ANME-2 cluster archaeon]